jgi:DNA-binding NtrC family response regulator
VTCNRIAEDNIDIRKILVDALRDAELGMMEARTADAAAQLLDPDGLRVIFTGIHLPGRLNDIGRVCAARQINPDIPVADISGSPPGLEEARAPGDLAAFHHEPSNLEGRGSA